MCKEELVDYSTVKFAKFEAHKKYFNSTIYRGEFIFGRIDPKTVPEGKFLYHTRRNSDCYAPVTIEQEIIDDTNFCGSLITDKEIEFPNKDNKCIEIKWVLISH